MTDSLSPSTKPIPPMTPGERLVLWIIGIACLCGLAYMLTGCVSVPTADGGQAYVPGVTGEGIESAIPFLPGPVKALAPFLLLLFPKVRDNAVAAVSPSTPSEQRAPAALAAAIPYFNSPPVVREKQARREKRKAEKRATKENT